MKTMRERWSRLGHFGKVTVGWNTCRTPCSTTDLRWPSMLRKALTRSRSGPFSIGRVWSPGTLRRDWLLKRQANHLDVFVVPVDVMLMVVVAVTCMVIVMSMRRAPYPRPPALCCQLFLRSAQPLAESHGPALGVIWLTGVALRVETANVRFEIKCVGKSVLQ